MIWYLSIWYLSVPYHAFRYFTHTDISIWFFFDIILSIYHIILLWYIDIWISLRRLKNHDKVWRSIMRDNRIFYVSAQFRIETTVAWLNQGRKAEINRYAGAFRLFTLNTPSKNPQRWWLISYFCQTADTDISKYISIFVIWYLLTGTAGGPTDRKAGQP